MNDERGDGAPADARARRVLGGRYELEAKLAEGGLGVVHRARDRTRDKVVAVKLMHPEIAAIPDLRERFRREAKALATLSHPNVVAVEDFGDEADVLYLVMELLDGESLADRLDRGPVALPEALAITRDVLSALDFAHARGLLHRDLKPANVFLEARPVGAVRAKLLDFGLVRFLEVDSTGHGEPTLTRAGFVVGTPEYMAPEQAGGGRGEPRSDLYAVGVMLFEMLTGRPPFVADTMHAVMNMHLFSPVPRLSEIAPGLATPALEAWFDSVLAKEVAARPRDARSMLDGLVALGVGLPLGFEATVPFDTARGPVARDSAVTLAYVSREGPTAERHFPPDARASQRWPAWIVLALVLAGIAIALALNAR